MLDINHVVYSSITCYYVSQIACYIHIPFHSSPMPFILNVSNNSMPPSSHYRTALSKALITCSKVQDPTPSLLETLAVALLTTFSASESTSRSAQDTHSKALLRISSLASNGFIGDAEGTPQLLTQLVSAFTVLYSGASSNSTTVYPVNAAVSNGHVTLTLLIH